jgi:alkylation response protein AidB-like acyl-CoA dehydrogenase
VKLFRAEHRNALSIFFGDGSDTYAGLLEGLASVLAERVIKNSPDYDLKKRDISGSRQVLFENGVGRMIFPKALEGLELPFGMYSLAMELIGSADAPTAMSMGIHNTVADGILRFGNEAQRKMVGELVAGRKLASFALTEPTSGSDARNMKTTAVKKGSTYVINGSKMFITNAGESDVYLVFAATEKSHAAFVVERTNPGIIAGDDIPKLGMRGSRTAEVRFVNCEVSEESLVGQDGMGFEYVKAMLNASRIIMGSICVGIAGVALEKALNYTIQRKMFGHALSDFQLTKEKIANMRTEINAARLLCLYAAKVKEMGIDYASEAAQAKVFATEAATRICDQTIQILGGYGYTNDDIHRHWRDARLLTIGEGTSEVLRLLIANKELARSNL